MYEKAVTRQLIFLPINISDMKKLFSAICFIMVACLLFAADPIVLDKNAKNPFLRLLAPGLEKIGIDVMLDWRSKVETGLKPILAPLANYPVKFNPAKERWMDELNRGIIGGLTVIKSGKAIAEDDFLNKWNSIDKKKRVFISFAKEDVEIAKKIKAILEKKKCAVFIYLQKASGTPLQSTFRVGELIGSAGIHLVLDTETARKKSGVMAEALSYARYIHPFTVNYHVVKIYGTNDSEQTREAIKNFRETGAKVHFINAKIGKRVRQIMAIKRQYLRKDDKGKDLYPLIKVDGKFVMPKDWNAELVNCRTKGPLRR